MPNDQVHGSRVGRRAVMAGLAAMAVAPRARAETTLGSILALKRVSVGFVNNKPWSYREASGQIVGIEADLIRAIFAQQGITEIQAVSTEFNGLIPGLQARRFDVSNGGLYVTPQRCQLVRFSNPYLRVGDGLVVKTGNPHDIHSYKDLVANPALRFGTTRGSINSQNADMAGIPMGRQLLLPDAQAVISALQADRLDAAGFSLGLTIALMDDPNVKGLERAVPFTGYVQPNGTEKLGYAAFAFRQADADLQAFFNTGIARLMQDGGLRTILERYKFSAADLPTGIATEQLCKPG